MKRAVSIRSNKICAKIRLERLKRKLSQDELAGIAGISAAGLGRIERAEVSPTIITIEKLAEATFIMDSCALYGEGKFLLPLSTAIQKRLVEN